VIQTEKAKRTRANVTRITLFRDPCHDSTVSFAVKSSPSVTLFPRSFIGPIDAL